MKIQKLQGAMHLGLGIASNVLIAIQGQGLSIGWAYVAHVLAVALVVAGLVEIFGE